MNYLLGWEYSRIWCHERIDYLANRGKKETIKKIKPDLLWNLKLFQKIRRPIKPNNSQFKMER